MDLYAVGSAFFKDFEYGSVEAKKNADDDSFDSPVSLLKAIPKFNVSLVGLVFLFVLALFFKVFVFSSFLRYFRLKI